MNFKPKWSLLNCAIDPNLNVYFRFYNEMKILTIPCVVKEMPLDFMLLMGQTTNHYLPTLEPAELVRKKV